MPDVLDVLRNLPHAVTPVHTSPDAVAADVARGRHAVSRRRRQRLALSGAVLAAVAVVVVGADQIGRPAGPPAGSTAQPMRLELVTYAGTQPAGFKVSTVPKDWQVLSSDEWSFVVAPPGVNNSPAPSAGPGVPSRNATFGQDGISVSLQSGSHFPDESPLEKVDINGKVGLLGHPLEAPGKLSATRWLIFPDSRGHNILVDVPAPLRLTDQQVATFAAGITVTGQALTVGG
ncbi:hypothetical protein [Actinoplanes sp. NBRC 103695]|uniref:hypothetical protein n=1 Tax=Actinoplanes sp. NBRC 103695 TaxID=3032202 RepID=UPI0024A19F6E|nr:hypothetical protein [Actinoplanes sp. NBRC 103695]GLZ02340.1 hypothetical protein Acsp02_95910 [Actinoplanes sp. NBRC 103695]